MNDSPAPARDSRLTVPIYAELSDWLAEAGLRRKPAERVFRGFCDKLAAIGVPIHRARTTLYTFHPSIETVSLHWHDNDAQQRIEIDVTQSEAPAWIRSPLKHMVDNEIRQLRRRLAGPDAKLDFSVLEEFAAEGFADYYARLYGFALGAGAGRQPGNLSRWLTREDGGFSDDDIAIIEALIPPLSLALQVSIDREIAENLLDAYLGRFAGRRVLTGEITRGSTQHIHAALMFADLSDFTAASDTLELDALVGTLNRLFDAMVGPVHDQGGNVLKFLGDGLLAIFPVQDGREADACRAALTAACDAMAATDAINAERRAAGLPTLPLHVALNTGEVAFGNIGGRSRMDFTVIGPAVNQASRIEKLCRPLQRQILMTEDFATQLDPEQTQDLGPHDLRGVRAPVRIFGIRAMGS